MSLGPDSPASEDRWLSEQTVSAMTEIPVETLRSWRTKRVNLPYSKIGALVRYSESAVREHLKSCQVAPQ